MFAVSLRVKTDRALPSLRSLRPGVARERLIANESRSCDLLIERLLGERLHSDDAVVVAVHQHEAVYGLRLERLFESVSRVLKAFE